jgi:DNA-binding GntR family transcriptional regulator
VHPRFSRGKISDDARRVRSCAIGADRQTANLAHEAVSDVEMHLLQRGWPVGEALGAIPDIQKILGLGRPACREAIIILEARGLLEVRRGRKGGLFVAAPTAEDVVGAMLMYLAISGVRTECVHEFRVLVWRMVVEAAIKRRVSGPDPFGDVGQWGFAFDLAQCIGNPAMVLASQIAEMLILTCEGRPAPVRDASLETAIKARDLPRALSRLEALAGGPVALAEPVLALETIEYRLVRSERRTAMSLAAKMIREMIHNPDTIEAEWETADRLGYPDLVVRQARRILQDFGIGRCRRGSRGVLWGPAAGPAGVIRMLTPCLMASGMTASDNTEAFCFLAASAARLGAGRTDLHHRIPKEVIGSFTNSLDLIDLLRMENLLLELAGNPLVSIMARSLGLANFPRDRPVGMPCRADIVVANHRILRAVEAGDGETAAALARVKAEALHYFSDRQVRIA